MASMFLIGNPGCGKSTTMNRYIGELVFQSGVSDDGSGITWKLDERSHNGRLFMDTPGLADLVKRKQAAEAIDQVLKRGGSFHIVFVMTLEAGRLKSDDLTTMKLVFDAVGDQVLDHSFAILVNKCSKGFLKKLNLEKFIAGLHTACSERNIPVTRHIHFAPEHDDLKDEQNVVIPLDPPTQSFCDNLPSIVIDGERVDPVNADAFEEMLAKMAELSSQVERAVQSEAAAVRAQRDSLLAEERAREDAARAAEQEALAAKKVVEINIQLEAEAAKAAQLGRTAAKAVEDAKTSAEQSRQAVAYAKTSAEKAKLASAAAVTAEEDKKKLKVQKDLLEEQLRLQRDDQAKAQKELEKAKEQLAETGFDVLSLQMRATDWLGPTGWISGYGMKGIIAELSVSVPKAILPQVYSIEAAKSNYTIVNIVSLSLLASKVGGFRLRNKSNTLIYTSDEAGSHFVAGSWVYSIDAAGETKSWVHA